MKISSTGIVDGKILLTGDQSIVEKIDKQGFDWVKAEYGVDVKRKFGKLRC